MYTYIQIYIYTYTQIHTSYIHIKDSIKTVKTVKHVLKQYNPMTRVFEIGLRD